MGDRVSIQFKNGDTKSVVLFHHWGGKEFVQTAKAYVADMRKASEANNGSNCSTPFSRLEPEILMVDFIREATKKGPNDSLYLGATEKDGDNSDNGHYIIEVKTGRTTHVRGEFESE